MEALLDYLGENPVALNAITSVFGVIVSAILSTVVSMRVSKRTSKTEIEKLQMEIKHEDEKTVDQEFSEMVADVGACGSDPLPIKLNTASSSVARVMAREDGDLGEALYRLYQILRHDYDGQLADEALNQVIKERHKKRNEERDEQRGQSSKVKKRSFTFFVPTTVRNYIHNHLDAVDDKRNENHDDVSDH